CNTGRNVKICSKVTGVVGQAIRINCRYDKKTYSGHRKYWCHGYYRSSCEDVIDTKAVNGQRGRFSITDKRDGVFTVTMENLTMRDAGWYNCGIDKPGFDTMVAVNCQSSQDNTTFAEIPRSQPSQCQLHMFQLHASPSWSHKPPSWQLKVNSTGRNGRVMIITSQSQFLTLHLVCVLLKITVYPVPWDILPT
uniref:Immunoglobulin V-set domain-containing protein n=1 Tax=Callorhinchus milii TaxID=7868 RepID=A0A4W3JF32_CALMI